MSVPLERQQCPSQDTCSVLFPCRLGVDCVRRMHDTDTLFLAHENSTAGCLRQLGGTANPNPPGLPHCQRFLRGLSRLEPQENVYPMGASVQFYKMFLDADVRRHFSEYHALALIEWDVVVAHETR